MTIHIAVEGTYDKRVVLRLITTIGIELKVHTVAYGGIDKLLDNIEVMIEIEGVRTVAIIVDANDHPDHRWQAVKGRLERKGVVVPNEPDSCGTIICKTDEHPRIGIWMMPNNVSPGRIEDFVAKMIPDNDPVWPRSQRYVDRIPLEERAFKPQKEMSAKVHSWIATRKNPGFMGIDTGSGYLSTDGELCQTFIAWLSHLFAPEEDVGNTA